MRSAKQRQCFPRAETSRNRQDVPQEIQQEIPQENSEKHPDHTFKMIKTLSSMDQYTKKLTSKDIAAGCQLSADIVKVNNTVEELDLPKNTKSSKKYKITIDGSAERVEKTKTTSNIVMYYHDEETHPDEMHKECVVQLLCLGDEAHPKRLQGQDVPRESANQDVAIVGERHVSVMKRSMK